MFEVSEAAAIFILIMKIPIGDIDKGCIHYTHTSHLFQTPYSNFSGNAKLVLRSLVSKHWSEFTAFEDGLAILNAIRKD